MSDSLIPRRLTVRWNWLDHVYVKNEDYEELENLWLWIVDRYPEVALKALDSAQERE